MVSRVLLAEDTQSTLFLVNSTTTEVQFPPGQKVANKQIKDIHNTLHIVQEHVRAGWEHLWENLSS